MKKLLPLLITLTITGCATHNTSADAGVSAAPAPDVAEAVAQQQVDERTVANQKAMEQFAEFCKTAPCRKNLFFKLKQPVGKPLEYRQPLASPVIRNGVITIYPGEQLFIEADTDANKLIHLVAVDKNIHPEKTIVLQFWQTTDHGNGVGMQLDVQNPFAKPLRYHIGIMPLGITPKIYKTSSCPAGAKATASESWPTPVFQIVIAELRLLDPGKDDMSCIE